MASDIQEMPFVRLLATSDRPTREKALSSLQSYLKSGRTFTQIELLKIWKGLFFCLHHTSNPLPQQRLSLSLATLLLSIPVHVFIPFLSAFFQTIIAQWTSIPSLRLDKYLYLIRLYIANSFVYLSRQGWSQPLLDEWIAMMTGKIEGEKSKGLGVMDPAEPKVGDGLRYHVLDVWVDGLVAAAEWPIGLEKGILKPVETLFKDGVTKMLRSRARIVMEDERLEGADGPVGGSPKDSEATFHDDEFEGFD